jgi:glutathione S-transferase
MITIYHIEGRRSERVAWLMEELGLDYELVFTPMDIAASWQAIKDVHPMGAAPVIHDGDVWLCESAAILEYIIARRGRGRLAVKPDEREFARYLQWLHFAEGSAMNRLSVESMVKPFLTDDWAEKAPPLIIYLGAGERLLAYFETSLEGAPYFAGEAFTAADIMMELPVRFALMGGVDGGRFPNTSAWRERVTGRAAYQRMLARALPNGPPPHVRMEEGGSAGLVVWRLNSGVLK